MWTDTDERGLVVDEPGQMRLAEARLKLALLKGNRFSPWHSRAFAMLEGVEVTAFRAESEIQRRFAERDDGALTFPIERIYFDTQRGNPLLRAARIAGERYFRRAPRILPFADRLAGFDAIQSWELFTDWTAHAVLAKEKFGVPLSVMVWDNIPFNFEGNFERRAMKHRALRAADRFLVHTERSRRMLEIEGAEESKIVMVNPGVDTDMFSPGKADRASFGLDAEDFVILFVGWLLPRKGIDFLILAMHELLRDPAFAKHRIKLLIVGSGPGRNRVETLIARLGLGGHCAFAGSLGYAEMPRAYRSADVFVLPSIAMPDWQEQFGMALIEAMASGVPAIATYSGAIPEIAGDAAVLCQPNDFAALYEALGTLIRDEPLRSELGARGRARALDRFTLAGYVNALRHVYRDMGLPLA